MSDRKDLREKILTRWSDLKSERDPYMDQWREISKHITPASGRFLEGNAKHGDTARSRWNAIYDSTAVRAANILAAGMMSGLTDPSSQWFALTTGSPKLDESHEVRMWLDEVQRIMEMSFVKTNVYQTLHHAWREVGVYGVTAFAVLEDHLDGYHCYPLVCGEYAIACDYRGRPNALYRKLRKTAAQLIDEYGKDKVGRSVLEAYKAGTPDKSFRLLHAIEPRTDRDITRGDNKNMPYRNVVILIDSDTNDGILEDSGFNEFPCVIGRWGASASDVYSEEAPGMIAIGDAKQLQHEQLQKGNAIDYQVNPPLILPAAAEDSDVDFLPGGRSYIDNPSGAAQAQSAWNVGLDLNGLAQDINEVQRRINEAFCVDMFLMLSGRVGQMTATEVAVRQEEKLMMLGPVLSRLTNEVLKVLIERVFNILSRAGMLPPPPNDLRGQQLSIEYTSMLARSQRAIRANSLDQFLSRVGQVAQFKQEALMKIDGMAAVDEYADYYSVAPSVVVPTDVAMQNLQAQQQQAAQAQQQMQAQQSVDALAKLGKIPANEDTMATKALDGIKEMTGA